MGRIMKVFATVSVGVATAGTALAQDDFPPYPGPAGWTVTVDPMHELSRVMNDRARQQRAPFHFAGIAFEISREDGPKKTYHERTVLAEYWALQVSNLLEERGFEVTEEARFQRIMGMSIEQFRASMLQHVPYGMRDVAPQGAGLYVLLNEDPQGCSGDNIFAAVVMPSYPTEGVLSEYGEIAVLMIGGGKCASGRTGKAILNGLVREVRAAISGSRR